MESADRSSTSLTKTIIERDHDGGPVKPLDHPCRHDPDHTRMPSLAAEHDGAVILPVKPERDRLFDGLFDDAALHGLPGAVLLLKVGGDFVGLGVVGVGQ